MNDETYGIWRIYKEDHPSKLIESGLTLDEAREHCRDPETTSSKCKLPVNVAHTERFGQWFDAYEEE